MCYLDIAFSFVVCVLAMLIQKINALSLLIDRRSAIAGLFQDSEYKSGPPLRTQKSTPLKISTVDSNSKTFPRNMSLASTSSGYGSSGTASASLTRASTIRTDANAVNVQSHERREFVLADREESVPPNSSCTTVTNNNNRHEVGRASTFKEEHLQGRTRLEQTGMIARSSASNPVSIALSSTGSTQRAATDVASHSTVCANADGNKAEPAATNLHTVRADICIPPPPPPQPVGVQSVVWARGGSGRRCPPTSARFHPSPHGDIIESPMEIPELVVHAASPSPDREMTTRANRQSNRPTTIDNRGDSRFASTTINNATRNGETEQSQQNDTNYFTSSKRNNRQVNPEVKATNHNESDLQTTVI